MKWFRRPSAALVMGAMAGAVSALSFLPTSIPLIWQIVRAEEVIGLRHTAAAAFSVQSEVDSPETASERLLTTYAIKHLSIARIGEPTRQLGVALPDHIVVDLCATAPLSRVVQVRPRQLWAVSCVEQKGLQVTAGIPLDPRAPAQRVLGLVLLLATFVGIVTALGILRLLGPLSEVSRALTRVAAGERGVKVPETGLAELDELVAQLNSAARSVDDREDAILSRIEVVQEMARIVAHEIRKDRKSVV